jgi:hypothetical protein
MKELKEKQQKWTERGAELVYKVYGQSLRASLKVEMLLDENLQVVSSKLNLNNVRTAGFI